MMRHVLTISYYFPPMGGVPVRRILRYTRHLPDLGWRCTLLTADQPFDHFHPLDPAAQSEIPSGLRVLYAPARSGLEKSLVSFLSMIRRPWRAAQAQEVTGGSGKRSVRRILHESLIFPDMKRRWVRGAVASGIQVAAADPFQIVLATGYPWSAFLVAERISRAIRCPFVMDFRDAWVGNPRGLWTGSRNRALEARLVRSAAAIVVATESMRNGLLEQYPDLPPRSVVTVMNGYDPCETPPADPGLRVPGKLLLTYTGTFNDAVPPSPFDRTPYYLLHAVHRMQADARANLRIHLVGRVGTAHRNMVRSLGLEHVVESVGPVSHQRALQHQIATDVLLLILYSCPGSSGDLTGKLVEYVGSRTPILALADEGEVTRLIHRHELGWTVPPEAVGRITARLEWLVDAWRKDRLPRHTTEVSELSARTQVVELAATLGRVHARNAASGSHAVTALRSQVRSRPLDPA